MVLSLEIIVVIILLAAFSIITLKTRVLTLGGTLLGIVMGALSYLLGGFGAFAALTLFYIIGELSTRIMPKKIGHEQRSVSNVLGNAGAGLLALLVGSIGSQVFGFGSGIFLLGFFGAIATALADTVSSEIGMLSKSKPRLVTTLGEVESGTDGGVTALGTAASVLAASIVGATYFLMVQPSFFGTLAIVVAGTAGSLIDSVLGAVFERKGRMDNTQVNFVATMAGAIIAIALFQLFQFSG